MEQNMIAVLVLAYNAEDTVIDTLNSILEQTYREIYLIISDDASVDGTCQKIEAWLTFHKGYFPYMIFYRNEKNIGTSRHLKKNINKIPDYIEWVKIIGADDMLFPDCIKNNVVFVEESGADGVVYSMVKRFNKINDKMHLLPDDKEEIDYIRKIGKLSPKRQYQKLLKRDILCSPTAFINIDCFKRSGGCDTRIRNIEDWPMKLNITKNGYKINVMDRYTVYYRMGESVTKSSTKMFCTNFLKQYAQLKRLLCYPNIEKWRLLYYYQEFITYLRYEIIINLCGNKKNNVSKIVNILLCTLMPVKWKKCICYLKSRMSIKKEEANCR